MSEFVFLLYPIRVNITAGQTRSLSINWGILETVHSLWQIKNKRYHLSFW